MSIAKSLPFTSATQTWFRASLGQPTAVQALGWPRIAAGEHALLLAPTGSGKTLAACLWALDRELRQATPRRGYGVIYVSPMKALAYDVERNLRAPLRGIHHAAVGLNASLAPVAVDVRTGDTSASARQTMLRRPGQVMVTTPESLYLMVGSKMNAHFREVHTIIVDEIHALAGSKRGAHLALTLERLVADRDVEPQRIGLSATARPVNDVAAYLGGDREVGVVDTREPPKLSVRVELPVVEGLSPSAAGQGVTGQSRSVSSHAEGDWDLEEDVAPWESAGPKLARGAWPSLAPALLPLLLDKRSSIVFVQSRGAAERLVQQLHEQHGGPFALAHHGSLSHAKRAEVEEQLKLGQAKAIVATSSLELGIDMGAVEQVILVGSPGRVASGLQRVGRAGHGVGQRSDGLLVPRSPRDRLECAVIAQLMREGQIESVEVPRNPLDVLSQQVVAMCANAAMEYDVIAATVRRAHSFRTLSDAQLSGVLDMLSGHYPSTDFAELRPLLNWDRAANIISPRRSAKRVAAVQGGTIPDRGLFPVHLVGGEKGVGKRLGELDEEMVFEARAGQTFILGTSTWRIEDITRDRVLVSPAPGEPGTLPFWHGTRAGRPLSVGRRLGELAREVAGRDRPAALAWLSKNAPSSPDIAESVVDMIHEQKEATGTVPSDKTVVIERFLDELGDLRVCIHSPFGARVHAPWAMALESQLSAAAGVVVQTMWSDDGIALTLADVEIDPWADDVSRWTPEPEELEEQVIERLADTALFAGQFRENASRALLLLRRAPGRRAPLWAQRLRAQRLLAAARGFERFPMVLETYRSCLQDVFDMDTTRQVLRAIRDGDVRVEVADTPFASPFARSLAFEFVATWLYQGDAPVAERRAQALTLDRNLLRDLLGHAELRDLLDADAIEEVERELQGVATSWRARDPEELLDLLRRVGDLTTDELSERCSQDPEPWLVELRRRAEVAEVVIAGDKRWIAASDAGRYGEGLGVVAPQGLPLAYLAAPADPLRDLVVRYARYRGPFDRVQLARRFGVPEAQLQAHLESLVRDRTLVEGELTPGGVRRQWCHELVLRQIRRRTLARVRASLAPSCSSAYAAYLLSWQRLDRPCSLPEALIQLEGAPLLVSELEARILPARVTAYRPEQLDQLLASGQWVWVGHSARGARDGRIQLFRRERLHLLRTRLDTSPAALQSLQLSALSIDLLRELESYGASFLAELCQAVEERSSAEVESALMELVWAGFVTNDSMTPLRSLLSPPSRRGRRRARMAGGRWSPLRQRLQASDTERMVAWTELLLGRYGLCCKESLSAEAVPDGFGPVRHVLRAREERGQVQRGYFVEGLSGSQYGLTSAIDRLRQVTASPPQRRVVALAASDPAQPFGRLLPWPDPGPGGAPPRVVAKATVVLVDGAPFYYLAGSRGRLRTFGPARSCVDDGLKIEALAALRRGHGSQEVKVEAVDERPPAALGYDALLRAAEFSREPAGWYGRRR